MEIESKPLNKGETFCCSFKKAKEMFKDTGVRLSFAVGCREFGFLAESPIRYYCDKNVSGKIISEMCIYPNLNFAVISFYVLKQAEFSDTLRLEFENLYLPQYLSLYKEMQNLRETAIDGKWMLTEFHKGKLISHVVRLK